MTAKRKRPQKHVLIRVTTTTDYLFNLEAIDGRTPEEIIQEFFRDYPMDIHHAARDASRVGGATKVINAEVVEELEITR